MLLNSFRKFRNRKRAIRIPKRSVQATIEEKASIGEISEVAEQAANLVTELMVEKTPLAPGDPSYEGFKNEPIHIPVSTYIRRLLKLSKSELQCGLIAVVYLQRMLMVCPKLEISQINVRRLMFTAMMIASKSIQDIPYTNKYWAAISGTYATAEVNKMEIDMLVLLNWNVVVNKEDLDLLTSTQ